MLYTGLVLDDGILGTRGQKVQCIAISSRLGTIHVKQILRSGQGMKHDSTRRQKGADLGRGVCLCVCGRGAGLGAGEI